MERRNLHGACMKLPIRGTHRSNAGSTPRERSSHGRLEFAATTSASCLRRDWTKRRPIADEKIRIVNLSHDQEWVPASEVVSVNALALVRFGLRAADDPRICDTVHVIDALLKVETPCGPCWHRYNRDGYGEHEDGSPFDGTGVGRAWPLLTGERAHLRVGGGAGGRSPSSFRRDDRHDLRYGTPSRAGLGRGGNPRRRTLCRNVPQGRPGRSSGQTPSASSSGVRFTTARSLTCRRKRCRDI